MILHCDSCQRPLGEYLYGSGGIEEVAYIGSKRSPVSLPDMICRDCTKSLSDLRQEFIENKKKV